ncbi:fungal-specific transcription factor domain-containing protein [Xylaria digitata]|nr:fungal-specific transcription factor domain-containing protein [Xylaria digitata]
MESRGDAVNAGSSRRLAIPRRSASILFSRVDVGCDRGSPCSNCASAKLVCTFGVVASKTTTTKQRVLISAQYEQKIDEIAEGLKSIKALLQTSQVVIGQESGGNNLLRVPNPSGKESLVLSESTANPSKELATWDHSAQVVDFIKTVAEDRASRGDYGTEENDVLSSLKRLAWALEESNVVRDLSFADTRDAKLQDHRSMPPPEDAVLVLRWAKEHKMFFRIESLSRILPLENFTDICQKVYFAVDDYSQFDFILANAYLSYIFSEYIAVTGKNEYQDYCRRCRQNAQVALSHLPLLLPATLEAVATLTFGASYAVESSKATLAWTYISNAANLCHTLGLNRLANSGQHDQETRVNLFWMVVLLEKSLSLRLGRPSNMRDVEITTPLPSNPNIKRCSQISIIQGKIYDQLYSPTGLARSDIKRGVMAQVLASELREIINESKIAFQSPLLASGAEQDKMCDVYFKIELVKQLSLLTLILRAIPAPMGSPTTIRNDCAAAAREALDMHQQCMAAIQDNKNDQFMTNRYLHWGILHTPFVPFSVLFTRIVQLSDDTELFYLDRFSESLWLGDSVAESITHPSRLYRLLCQAARLCIKQDTPPVHYGSDTNPVDPWSIFDFTSFGNEAGDGADSSELDRNLPQGLSQWFYGNQQLMSLLDDNVMF